MSRVQAQHWLLRFSSGEISASEHMEFHNWLSADEGHQQEFDQLQQMWGELDLVADEMLEAYADTSTATTSPWKSWTAAASVAALLLVTSLLWLGSGEVPVAANGEQYASALGELREITLADGSQVTLGPHSRLLVNYSESQRQLNLQRGEAFFSVISDPARPFVVSARGGTTTAVGTAFSVHLGWQQVEVAVKEGRVRVDITAATIDSRQLRAGTELSYSAEGKLSSAVSIDATEIASWREGRRIFQNTPLAELVEDLNRYSAKPVILADARLNAIPVSGVFDNFADTAAVLRAVDNSLPARVEDRAGSIHIFYE